MRIEVYKKRATTHFYEYGSPLGYLNIFLIGVRAFRVGGKPHFILRSYYNRVGTEYGSQPYSIPTRT